MEPTDTAARSSDAAPPVRAAAADDAPRRPGISPSRASDFQRCPLLFRLRVVDRVPEPPSPAALRGTLVHAVLERLFDRPAGGRTPAVAVELLAPAWSELVEADPRARDVLDESGEEGWLAAAAALLDTYFTLEDPNRLEPAERELTVRLTTEDGWEMRGIVDRLDVAPDGAMRVVDYKTGRSPREGFENGAMFQMRFYALLLDRLRGRMPALLQLVYLGDGVVLRHAPDRRELDATERLVTAIWRSIREAARRGEFRPRASALCDWCAHQSLCPVFGGTPPALDPAAVERAIGVRPEPAAHG
ncbi:PD-(D/E)XK nuclease family protein [Isoptericola sp. b441]|uniref:PD-(D/E)XK nuclease family protein n=1 Tax=Actinotalea lenta TaxID=3064654 RepID=A0ABT9D9H1_9CELL|nr:MULTISPECIES: PD-(D/E)XK nuclease family protein [unclassified Isoptericola]MDO8107554.1 PD-(D/E)XK nuclease family protein [Isoptericola sp. b441]MDO8120786.1 PD-(D/E)XK nuclease family protein [Isoptericola sp. b490]